MIVSHLLCIGSQEASGYLTYGAISKKLEPKGSMGGRRMMPQRMFVCQ